MDNLRAKMKTEVGVETKRGRFDGRLRARFFCRPSLLAAIDETFR